MNIHALYHRPQSEYAFATEQSRATVRFRSAKDDLKKVELVVSLKFSGKPVSTVPMRKRFSDVLFDYYECDIETNYGRRLYYFKLTDLSDNVIYYTETGAKKPSDIPEGYFPNFQIPFVSKSDVMTVPYKFRNTVIYQIFPDRFYTRNPKLDWTKTPGRGDEFGGDLWGAAEKLEYIKSLGISAVYFTPLNPAHTNHHYDVEDYYHVADCFGGDDAFKAFVKRAHELGIKVIADGVFNHCSLHNPIFQDVVKNGKRSRYYDWFIIHGDVPEYVADGFNVKSCNYETFAWNVAHMPKLNSDNDEVRDYVCGVTKHWIEHFGVDAWRLDVADDVAPALWREVRKSIKSADSNAIMIGESFMDSHAFLRGDVFDGVMNYGFTRAVRDWLAYGSTDASGAANQLIKTYLLTNTAAASMMMNLIGSHDTPRFYSLCGENVFKHQAALAVMFFFDGMPMVYYGDEIPMSGNVDPDCRRCFDWSRTGGPTSELIKTLADMRADESAETVMDIKSEDGALVVSRSDGNKTNTLCVNITGDKAKTSHGTVAPNTIILDLNGSVTKIS